MVCLLHGAHCYFQFSELLISVHLTKNNSSSNWILKYCLLQSADFYFQFSKFQFGEMKITVRHYLFIVVLITYCVALICILNAQWQYFWPHRVSISHRILSSRNPIWQPLHQNYLKFSDLDLIAIRFQQLLWCSRRPATEWLYGWICQRKLEVENPIWRSLKWKYL